MKRIVLSLAVGLLFFLSLSPKGEAKMYIELGNGHLSKGVEIDYDHNHWEGALVHKDDGFWLFDDQSRSARDNITFRILFSIRAGSGDGKGNYKVWGAIYTIEMKSGTEISGGTVTELDAEVRFDEPYEIDTGMTHEEEKVTLKLLLKAKM